MLKLDDEAGGDSKILAVPIDKLSPLYTNVKSPRDLPDIQMRQIQHFFEHYKDLEPGKWVRVGSWVESEDARREIVESVARFRKAKRRKAPAG
jgi:inorganic pyrophosphatase